MFKKLNFSKKLLISVLGILFISSIVRTALVSINSYDSSERMSKEHIEELSIINSYKIKQDLERSIVLSKDISTFLVSMEKNDFQNKESILEIMKSVLANNSYILGVFVDLVPDSFFPNIKAFATKNGHDVTGRFAPYIIRDKDKIIVDYMDSATDVNPWFVGAKKSGKEFILEPYIDDVNGKNVLMTTVSAPIYIDNKFVGVVGVDISFDKIQKIVGDIQLFDNGYGFLITESGKMLAHKNRKLVGKKLTDIDPSTLSSQIVKNVQNKKSFGFDKVSLKTNTQAHYYIHSFEIGNSGINWGMGINVPTQEYLSDTISILWFSIIAGILNFLVVAAVIYYYTKVLGKNLDFITNGLTSFFSFLNKESKSSSKINIQSEDEFGKMASMINQNIDKTTNLINDDEKLIDDVKRVVESIKGGSLKERIEKSTINESLEELKKIFNEMLDVMAISVCKDINKIQDALKSFHDLDFTRRIEDASGKTSQGLNELADIINEMLVENKANGLTLQDSSNLLMQNVETLSASSSQAAASLEETSAALEEITSTIVSNTENVEMMSTSADELTSSAKQGQVLAQDTTLAMDDITEQVTLINEAISVIDQIAFQTNILSLNAAVEAATAGEAGKGFAVVAQEVRNLAARSAEAAKEIKDLVENATSKAAYGKDISSKMIIGYDELLDNINSVTNRILEVSNASKEQETGITQINNAIAELDQQTQQNAQVAMQTQQIANGTLKISQTVVYNANAKEFIGKESVKSKEI